MSSLDNRVIVDYIFRVTNHSYLFIVGGETVFLMRTRQSILEAVERMLQTKGLARLTNKAIAEAAGCAEGTLYNHFETKEALILATITENIPNILTVVRQDRVGEGSIEENVRDIVRATIRYYGKLLPLTTALFADIDLLNHFRLWMQEHKAGPLIVHEQVASYVAAEQRLGRIKPEVEPFFFTALLLGTCHQYAYIQCFQGQDSFPVSEDQFIAGVVQTLLLGGGVPQK
jgi:AcrR family transcriptional regulator